MTNNRAGQQLSHISHNSQAKSTKTRGFLGTGRLRLEHFSQARSSFPHRRGRPKLLHPSASNNVTMYYLSIYTYLEIAACAVGVVL